MRIVLWSGMLMVCWGLTGCTRGDKSEPAFQNEQPTAGVVMSRQESSTPPEPSASTKAQPQPSETTSQAQPTSSTPSATVVTLADGLTGKISSDNQNLKFVVLSFPVGQMAKVYQRLNVYRGGLKVGELVVTGPQREDSIVADITAGEAKTGDEVRDR